jgi:hypothetical protein
MEGTKEEQAIAAFPGEVGNRLRTLRARNEGHISYVKEFCTRHAVPGSRRVLAQLTEISKLIAQVKSELNETSVSSSSLRSQKRTETETHPLFRVDHQGEEESS